MADQDIRTFPVQRKIRTASPTDAHSRASETLHRREVICALLQNAPDGLNIRQLGAATRSDHTTLHGDLTELMRAKKVTRTAIPSGPQRPKRTLWIFHAVSVPK